MKLRGIDFGYVMNASGARNFWGQGYPFHRYWKRWGLDYTGSTLVTKSTTLPPRVGNMPLIAHDLQPIEFKPKCIKINFRRAAVLNAVGLSGPGVESLLKRGVWQQLQKPFFISFAAVAPTAAERLGEWELFVKMMYKELPLFRAPVAIEISPFCPNDGISHKPVVDADEIWSILDIVDTLGIPAVVKGNLLISRANALTMEKHRAFDGLRMSNAIPFGQLAGYINWQKLWGTRGSPLAKFGGGALSGADLFPLVMGWIQSAHMMGFRKPIIGCGGIMSPYHARYVLDTADAIQIGSMSMVRPWRVQPTIAYANAYAREKYGV